jgi:hypothetical protein
VQIASRFSAKLALAITVGWVAILGITGATEVLLFLAPALLIAIPLIGGRYVGEELIVKLATRRGRKPGRAAAFARPLSPAAPPCRQVRGTRLVAFSLAKRPPPARLLTQD